MICSCSTWDYGGVSCRADATNLQGKKMNKKFLLGVFSLLLVIPGCGDGRATPEQRIQNANPSNVFRLTNLYNQFSQIRNRGPKDEKEFRLFIENFGDKRLDRMGVSLDNLDNLFVSERDSQKFDIAYGERPKREKGVTEDPGDLDEGKTLSREEREKGPSLASLGLPVIFETTGVDGKKNVGFLGSRVVRELTEAEISSL